jgi:AcrR family transcriptional regulator
VPRKSNSSPKREELIEIASRLFYEQGYGATGIKQIIDEAEIAKGTFYSHFSSKEELGLTWLKERHVNWMAWLQTELSACGNAKEKLLGLFDGLGRWMEESSYRGCAFINTLAETPDASCPLREEVASHKKELHELVQGLAEAHFEGSGADDARQKGSLIFLLFEGALVETQNFRDLWPVQVARTETETLLTATP